MTQKKVKAGDVLVAQPFMIDPHFRRTAVLLVEHGEEGSLGFVMNRPLPEVRVDGLVADFPEFEAGVSYGGPVQQDTLHYLHNVGDLLDGSRKVSDGVWWGGDFDKLKFLIGNELIRPAHIRFFVGYAGWAPGQLEEELAYGSWVVADMDANYMFRLKPRTLWKRILEDKGGNYGVIAQMPLTPSWN